ncbi:MAG: hypothetical protein II996_03300 [Oscillospiraceae bacterium]|nr:hypothetical protein [Oscillospiraceae bacterium]
MIWYLIFMLMGALIFGAGIVFEKLARDDMKNDYPSPPAEETDPRLLRQWENLLGYDGTEQEEDDDENI